MLCHTGVCQLYERECKADMAPERRQFTYGLEDLLTYIDSLHDMCFMWLVSYYMKTTMINRFCFGLLPQRTYQSRKSNGIRQGHDVYSSRQALDQRSAYSPIAIPNSSLNYTMGF